VTARIEQLWKYTPVDREGDEAEGYATQILVRWDNGVSEVFRFGDGEVQESDPSEWEPME
jgi:hypothetical protein